MSPLFFCLLYIVVQQSFPHPGIAGEIFRFNVFPIYDGFTPIVRPPFSFWLGVYEAREEGKNTRFAHTSWTGVEKVIELISGLVFFRCSHKGASPLQFGTMLDKVCRLDGVPTTGHCMDKHGFPVFSNRFGDCWSLSILMKLTLFAAILEVLVAASFAPFNMGCRELGFDRRKSFRLLCVKEDLHVRSAAFSNFFSDDAICAITDCESFCLKELLLIVVVDGEAPLLSFIIVTLVPGSLGSCFSFDILCQS